MTILAASSNGVPFFFFFIFAIIAVVVSVAISSQRRKQLTEGLRKLSGRLGGRVTEGGMFGEPSIEFSMGGRPARMEFYPGSKNKEAYSRLSIAIGGLSPGTLHIVPEGFGEAFLKLFGAQDLEVGDPRFDSEYVLKATPASLVSKIFSPDRRDKVIASVRRLSNFRRPTIDLDCNHLTVRVREFVTEEGRLLAMVSTGEDFLRYVFGAPAPAPVVGIQWGEVKVSGGGECPVCGTPMNERVVRCESCRTPHHDECWKYMGRCSTYACKGTRAVA